MRPSSAAAAAVRVAWVTTPYTRCGTASPTQSIADQVRGSLTPSAARGTSEAAIAAAPSSGPPTAVGRRSPALRSTPASAPTPIPAAIPDSGPSPANRFRRSRRLPPTSIPARPARRRDHLLGRVARGPPAHDHVQVGDGVERGRPGRAGRGAAQEPAPRCGPLGDGAAGERGHRGGHARGRGGGGGVRIGGRHGLAYPASASTNPARAAPAPRHASSGRRRRGAVPTGGCAGDR